MTLHCPAGHGPFEDWAERCPECGNVLAGREPIVYLATAPNETIAQLWLEALRGAGIRAMAKDLGPGIGGWGTAVGLEHALYVLATDLGRARRVVAELTGQPDRRRRTRRLAAERPHRPAAVARRRRSG
jgi:hypothetical protein